MVHIEQTIPLAPEELEEKIQCRVLDCDTISQVKHKILDALYRNTPFSLRPSIHEVDLGECFVLIYTVQGEERNLRSSLLLSPPFLLYIQNGGNCAGTL